MKWEIYDLNQTAHRRALAYGRKYGIPKGSNTMGWKESGVVQEVVQEM